MNSGMKRDYRYALLALFILFSVGCSMFCPVRSPLDEIVYVTDNANQSLVALTLTQCSMKCAFCYADQQQNCIGTNSCRCFNYNSTSMNCSLFNYEPTNYGVDNSTATKAYQFKEMPLTGLWKVVPADNCSFPFPYNGQTFLECRRSIVADPYCAVDYYSCRLPDGRLAFCIPNDVSSARTNDSSAAQSHDLTVASASTTTTTTVSMEQPPSTTQETQDATSTSNQLGDPENCSFPFTYNGGLHFSCIQDMTNVTNSEHPFACLKTNRSAAVCILAESFVAVNIKLNLTVGTQPAIAVTSVFGWIIFHQNTNSSPAFNWNLTWASYKNGFGSPDSDFWLGLERVHQLTSSAAYRLRIEIQTVNGTWYSAEHWTFVINSEADKYRLLVDGYTGDAGDGLKLLSPGNYNLINGMNFTTIDQDNDLNNLDNCVATVSSLAQGACGGFWYNACTFTYFTCTNTIQWKSSTALLKSAKTARMMIKPQ